MESEENRTPLMFLPLSLRTYNLLRRKGYDWIEEIQGADLDSLAENRGFGMGTIGEIAQALADWERQEQT